MNLTHQHNRNRLRGSSNAGEKATHINLSTEHTRNLATRKRLLEAARLLFSEGGLKGADLREISRHAGLNLAALHHHFHNKEEMFGAVLTEAGRQLAAAAEETSNRLAAATPEARLSGIVHSLFHKLGENHAWIARVFARLLADSLPAGAGWIGLGLERYFLLLQTEIKELLGPQAASEAARLYALSVIAQCMFCCLAGEKLPRLFPHLPGPLPTQETMARHVVSLSLKACFTKDEKPLSENRSHDKSPVIHHT